MPKQECWRSRTVLWRPTRCPRTNTKKRCPFHHGGLECKSKKSRNTWSNRHFGLGVQNEAWQRLIAFCQQNALVIQSTLFQQHNGRLYIWASLDGQYQNQINYILCSQRWRSSIQPAQTRPGANCGSDHELFIAKFRLKLKKAGATTRPFRYDLNQIPYNYAVEVRNRFKGLNLIECLKNYDRGSWHFTGDRGQNDPQEKEMQKSKMAVWEGLTNSWQKKRSEKQRRKVKIHTFESIFPKNSKKR